MKEFTHSLTIAAPPAAVLDAFFDHEALATWWHVTRSLCVARPLGVYAIEWTPTEWKDDVLGRLGGAFRGTVNEFKAGREFFIADAYWLPPDGEAIGPMALEVALQPEPAGGTRVRVTQTGYEESARWRRYYEVIGVGWSRALGSLKALIEH